MKDNEETACNALRSMLLVRNGTSYTIERRPDKENSNSKDIDFIMVCPGQPQIAVEHTSIESFEGQLTNKHWNADLVNEVARQINIPSNTSYVLSIPFEMNAKTVRDEKRDSLVRMLADWINSNIPNLKLVVCQLKIEVLSEYTIRLRQTRSHPNLDGKLIPEAIAPKKLNTARKERIARALSSKLPNLIPYATKDMLTFLLIEEWDINLSSAQITYDVVLGLRQKYQNVLPYSIVQVTSCQERVVEAWVLKEGEDWGSEVNNECAKRS